MNNGLLTSMRMVFLIFTVLGPVFAQDGAREIIRRSVEADRRNDELSHNYTFVQRVSRRTLNGDGSVKKTENKTFDVTLCDGTPYERLIEIDDKPLPPDMERKEQEKLRKSIEQRRKESPQQRAKRIAEWEKERQKEREFVRELCDAMDFSLDGEEEVNGRKAWVIEAMPHPGYKPRSSRAKFLTKVRGRIWIDQQDYIGARLEAETMDDVSMGAFLAKVHKGTRFELEQVRVNDEVWLPKHFDARLSVRVLVARLRAAYDVTFRDYRKFQTDSRILATDADIQ